MRLVILMMFRWPVAFIVRLNWLMLSRFLTKKRLPFLVLIKSMRLRMIVNLRVRFVVTLIYRILITRMLLVFIRLVIVRLRKLKMVWPLWPTVVRFRLLMVKLMWLSTMVRRGLNIRIGRLVMVRDHVVIIVCNIWMKRLGWYRLKSKILMRRVGRLGGWYRINDGCYRYLRNVPSRSSRWSSCLVV